jgi:hypothetical protein
VSFAIIASSIMNDLEQHGCVKFCLKLEKTFQMVKQAYGRIVSRHSSWDNRRRDKKITTLE